MPNHPPSVDQPPPLGGAIRTATRAVDAVLGSLIVTIFVLLVACVFWQVFSRYVLGAPTTVTDEIARFLFMWAALFGAAYTFGQARHLAIDIVAAGLSPPRRRILRAVITLFVAGFAAVVMVYGGYELTMRTLASGQVTPVLRLPMGYVYGAIPAAGVLILFYAAAFLADPRLAAHMHGDDGAEKDNELPAAPAGTTAAAPAATAAGRTTEDTAAGTRAAGHATKQGSTR